MARVSTSGKVGRNDFCPCGSGAKYKFCCAGKQGVASYVGWIVMAVVVLAAATIFILNITRGGGIQAPNQVWSTEHGHYH